MKLFNTPYNQLFARTLIYTSILSSLTACGGGGNTTPTIPPPSPPPTQITVNTGELSGTFVQQLMPNAVDVWDLQNSTGKYIKGQGITIATVDTGANLFHEDFRDDDGYLRVNLDDAISITYSDGLNTIDYNQSFIDINTDDYHGTHVSSIALGREYGIAPSSTLLPINTYYYSTNGPEGPGYYTDTYLRYKGFEYAANKAPIVNISSSDMVNLSIIDADDSELNNYLATLKNNDVALVVAAGNEGVAIGAEHFNNSSVENIAIQPGIENQVLSVIAVKGNDPYSTSNSYEKTNYTNYPGSCENNDVIGGCTAPEELIMTEIQNTFISAPGGNGFVTEGITAADGATLDSSKKLSGTSMAAPVVSGGLALLMSAWDNLTVQQAIRLLKDNANRSFSGYSAAEFGVGILDIRAAFEPSGDLKSTASVSSTASYSLTESSASIPASLSGLTKLAALKSVAYFDDYNREFLLDITPSIQVEQSSLDWNRFWKQSQPYPNNQNSLGKYQLSMSFANQTVNNSTSSELQQLAITNAQSRFEFKQHSPVDLMQTQLNPLMSHFYSNNQNDFGHTLAMQQDLGTNLSLFSAVQEQDKAFNRVVNNQNKILAQVQTIGLHYHPNSNWSFALSSQLRQEQDGLMGLQGSGTFSFGEHNRSQINTVAVQYSHNGIHLYSQLQQGQLLDSKHASGSYIQINKTQMGQLKLGVMQQTSEQTIWGLQAYNENTLLNSNIQLTIPTGMTASGEIENQTLNYQHKSSLQPDTLELFYKQGLNHALQYQFNAIKSPQDSGFGLRISRMF